MDKHFTILRRKLSILAMGIVFSITLLVGVVFLSYQYWSGHEDTISKAKLYQSEVLKLDITRTDLEKLKDNPKFSSLFRNFFLLLDASGSIQYNHSPYPTDTEWRELVGSLREWHTLEDDEYMFSRFRLSDGWEFVSIVFLPYSEADYTKDIVEYTIFLLFLSALIYFAVDYLVGYILKPVEENMKTMKYFVQVAGHELKTPLASILSSVQLLLETKAYDEETVRDIENETKKSGELIGSLSELSSMSDHVSKEEVHISEILQEVLQDLSVLIKEKQLDVKVDLQNDVTVLANRYYAYIFVSNILANAVKYNDKWGKIRVILDHSHLSIQDTGIGIQKNQLSKIFDVFYRVSSHRERSEGLGLGLALVRKIATLYGWNIHVRSDEGTGTEFEVSFNV